MKAVISSTNDPLYSFFIPIVNYCWGKLSVETICFSPKNMDQKTFLSIRSCRYGMHSFGFECPPHKEATYAQCSRLYAGALDLPKDEWLITSDVDMAVFNEPAFLFAGKYGFAKQRENFTVVGYDLTPENQYPICYICGSVAGWRQVMNIGDKTYQYKLDELLESIDCENMRGNYWGKDQEEAFNRLSSADVMVQKQKRAKPGAQFADNRVDRDDINWRSYLGPDLIDAHLWRPGYEENNFANIMELLTTQYPNDNFQWLIDYRLNYLKLL